MIKIRKSEDRGMTEFEWLDSQHTFSFGNYHDPNHMGFGALRVINEDKVDPARGFDLHPHRDMEIITYVLDGTLRHKDTLGTSSLIKPGELQRMSAGRGVWHSEHNPREDSPVHLLQIWIIPEKKGLPPSYEQKNFIQKRSPGKLTLLGSPKGSENSLTIHQDVFLYVLDLDGGQSFVYSLANDRIAWVQVARGALTLNEEEVKQGDGVAVIDEQTLEFKANEKVELLIFDLANGDSRGIK